VVDVEVDEVVAAVVVVLAALVVDAGTDVVNALVEVEVAPESEPELHATATQASESAATAHCTRRLTPLRSPRMTRTSA
jgi:hypothetical protein